MENLNDPQVNEPSLEKKETITELARRHMADPSHTTTDEELKNAQLELSENVQVDDSLFEIDNTTVVPPLPMEKTDNDTDEEPRQSPVPNPYSVLGS